MAPKTGHNMKLYRNTGTVASPTWSEVTAVTDVTVNGLERVWAAFKHRGSDFTKTLASLLEEITVEFRLTYGLDSTNYNAIRAAFFSADVEQWAVMNGAITTEANEGLKLPCGVKSFPWDQPLEDVSGHDVVLSASAYMEEPAGTEIDPAWYTVPAAE
jgi:hypothetical protein